MSARPGPRYLPGDPEPAVRRARMLRVDHAGEYGAVRIYAGQRAVLDGTPAEAALRHMAAQEAEHLAAFDRLLPENRVRPTMLAPVWHVMGWLLGWTTARIGPEAAMACTVAVEEVIDRHYAGQAETLAAEDPALAATIEKFRQEEVAHRDAALAADAERAPAYPLLTAAVRGISRAAIRLSERI
ncbi:MAG: demethoxyubiquinone hydroxylase family protein [Alphaproteobacteria bacterium]